jgi:hypothetical protein
MTIIAVNEIVKRPNTKSDYNGQDLDDLARCIADPLYFMRTFMMVQHPIKGALPFVPYECQERIINGIHDHRFCIILTARQQGKTSCAAGYLLWRAMFVPDTTILVVANKYLQALEVMKRVRYAYENLPDHIRAGASEYNKGSITFDNGSRIEARATSDDAGRGLAASLVYIDEFSFVKPNLQKEFFTSLQPVLSTGGSCIITSTPKNDEDQFAQIWKGAIDNTDDFGNVSADGCGKNKFFAVMSPWWEHPDRDEEWARPFRESLGEARFAQEFACEFVTDDDTLMNPLTLSRLHSHDPIFYTGTIRWYAEPEPNKTYLVALDPSLGMQNDFGAIQIFQLPEMIQIAEWQNNTAAPRRQVVILMEALYALDGILRENPLQMNDPDIYWTFENNTIGEAILTIVEDTGEERFPGSLVTERRRKGLQMKRVRKGLYTSPKARLSSLARMKSLVESGRMTIHSRNLIKELKNFVTLGGSFRAKPGEHDDLVMATSLIVRMVDIVLAWGTMSGNGDLREYINDEELGLMEEIEPMPVVI